MTAVLSPTLRQQQARVASPATSSPTGAAVGARLGFRDRTNELRSIFDLIRQSTTPSVANPKGGAAASLSSSSSSASGAAADDAASLIAARKRPALQQQQSQEMRRFNESAGRFSTDLAQLAGTVANLTRLTQGSGGSVGGSDAFEENSVEIARLTQVVRTRLGSLHDDLQSLADLKQASNESMQGSNNSAIAKHNEAVVSALRSKLVGTGNSFRQVLQKRTDAMKSASTRRSKLLADRGGDDIVFGSAAAVNKAGSGSLFSRNRDDDNPSATDGGAAASASSSSALMLQQRNSNIGYLKDRQAAVHEIEVAVREVSEIVQDFSRLVYEQDEFIVRIDNEVEESLVNVTEGSGQLMQYLSSLSSQRGFILKIMAVLFCFLMFFGFFVVR